MKLPNISAGTLPTRKVGRHRDFTYIITLNLSDVLWPLEYEIAQKIPKHVTRSYDECPPGTMNAQT